MNNLIKEFNEILLCKCFEVKVLDNRTNEEDYILFNISINEDKMQAQHVALTQKQEDSKYIAFTYIELDEACSLNEHLQELFSACEGAILNSDFYQLAE